MSIQAVIFDLDGVITDTAIYHAQAWERLAISLDVPFNEHDNEGLKGIDRMASLEIILAKGKLSKSMDEKKALAEQKNNHYRSLIDTMTTDDILPGANILLQRLRLLGVRLGLASSSKNASLVLERLNIGHCFDYVADAELIKNNKPDPEIFLTVASALNVAPSRCIGIEDSAAGIRAIKSAGMVAVGIGNPVYLCDADAVYATLSQLVVKEMMAMSPVIA